VHYISSKHNDKGIKIGIPDSEDCSVCYQNADREISLPESFFCNIHTAIHDYLWKFYALPDR